MDKSTMDTVYQTIVHLNSLYGRGRVCIVDFVRMQVEIRIQITQSRYSNGEFHRFRFDGSTVFFCGHQKKIL